MSRYEFSGKTAVLTGAGSGIGRALAHDLASRGVNLALADIRGDRLEDVKAELGSNNIRVTRHIVDVSDRAALERFHDDVVAAHGGADLLFNVAGVALGGEFSDYAMEDFEWLMNINFWAPVRLTKLFMPELEKSEDAHITNISSLFGLIAPARQTAYSASKFGLRGFSDALRHELADTHIGVTTVHPGGVATRIAKDARIVAAATAEEISEQIKASDEKLVMPPPKAAAIILKAVEKRKARVLVGNDAKMAALIERFFPASYWKVIQNFLFN